jgi:uncharacterized membrane protein YebE (DUF533 family)
MTRSSRKWVGWLVFAVQLAALLGATEALSRLKGSTWLRVAVALGYLVYTATAMWEQGQRHRESLRLLERDHARDIDRLDAAWRRRTGEQP